MFFISIAVYIIYAVVDFFICCIYPCSGIYTYYYDRFKVSIRAHCDLPSGKPSCLQTTLASLLVQCLPHIAHHSPLTFSSIMPESLLLRRITTSLFSETGKDKMSLSYQMVGWYKSNLMQSSCMKLPY